MDLNPGQLFALKEMGIPVWELRSDNSSQLIETSPESLLTNDEVLAEISACRLIVLTTDVVTDEKEKRLLHALVLSLGLKFNDLLLMTNNEFEVVEEQLSNSDQKLLLILADESTSSFIESSKADCKTIAKCYTTRRFQWPAFISFSLKDLLKQSELKAILWQDLKLLKSHLTAP